MSSPPPTPPAPCLCARRPPPPPSPLAPPPHPSFCTIPPPLLLPPRPAPLRPSGASSHTQAGDTMSMGVCHHPLLLPLLVCTSPPSPSLASGPTTAPFFLQHPPPLLLPPRPAPLRPSGASSHTQAGDTLSMGMCHHPLLLPPLSPCAPPPPPSLASGATTAPFFQMLQRQHACPLCT